MKVEVVTKNNKTITTSQANAELWKSKKLISGYTIIETPDVLKPKEVKAKDTAQDVK